MQTIDVPEVMTEVASQIARIPDFGGRAYYPPRNQIEESPTVMVRQSNDYPTTYEKARLGVQVVYPNIDVVILVQRLTDEERPSEEARIDGLISPILDLFDVSAEGGSVNARLPGLSGHVDRIWHTARVKRGAIDWAGTKCYGAVITLDSAFKRKPQAITLEDTP